MLRGMGGSKLRGMCGLSERSRRGTDSNSIGKVLRGLRLYSDGPLSLNEDHSSRGKNREVLAG
jgi:hypothetical protein